MIFNAPLSALCLLLFVQRKSNDAEIESLREEYHQRVATLERKVWVLITAKHHTLSHNLLHLIPPSPLKQLVEE